MTDHAQEMLDRLLAQFDGKPRFEALIRVLGRRLNKLEQVFSALQEKRWIDTSEGAQLDGCGVIVDQSRFVRAAIAIPFFGFIHQPSTRGFSKARFLRRNEPYVSSAKLADPEYGTLIKAKIAKNTSLGTSEEVISSFQNIFNAPKVILTETGNAKVRIGIARNLLEGEILFAQAINLFVKPAGIGIALKSHFEHGKTFGFKSQGLQGFGVGKLAKTFEGGLGGDI